MNKPDAIQAYYKLRDALDTRCDTLNIQHKENMQCKAGCDSCCENISVFPIEFDAIKKEMGTKLKELKIKRLFNRFRKSCVFLKDSRCMIYDSRPFICRTQGLPLLYQNEDGTAYELSVCHLNFKGIDVNVFNAHNAVYMPEYNSQLFLINQSYAGKQNKKRIALYKLLK